MKYRLRTVDTPADDGTDFFSAGISVPLPIASTGASRSRAAAKLAARDGARARLAAEVDAIDADLTAAEASWARAWEKSRHYAERLIPAARSALETTLNEFAVDRAEFSSLYEAEIDLLELERAHVSAVVETHLQRAIVRALTGTPDLGDSA